MYLNFMCNNVVEPQEWSETIFSFFVVGMNQFFIHWCETDSFQ